MLTVQNIAKELCVSEQWVRSLIREGVIKAQKFGRSWAVTESEFKNFKLRQGMLFEDFLLPKSNANSITALSFFSGAMGLDLGLEKAGIHFCLLCESDKTCQATIRANRPDIPLIGDIWQYTASDIRKIAKINGDIDLIVGGPPCQAFSTAGARRGFEDERGNVFLHYIDLILELKPKYIVIENVRGLLSAPLKHIPHNERLSTGKQNDFLNQPGGALLYIIEKLRNGGYDISFNLYNAANYGVPQIRERVVIICSREGGKVPYLNPTNSNDPSFNLPKWKTLKEAISNVRGCDHTNFPESRLQYYRLLKAGQYWKDLPKDLQPLAMGNSYKLGGGKTGFYRRLDWNKPSCTLVTSPTMPATDICHPTEDRPLSIQEYKRIQMFPDDWKICGDLAKQYKQIGNAVPTGLGEAIGKAIMNHMQGIRDVPPENFPFSRYKNTDDISWEKNTRKRLNLKENERLFDKKEIYDVVKLKK